MQQAAASNVYKPVLHSGAQAADEDIGHLHDLLAGAGGMSKNDCFSPLNITHSSYFSHTYRGITSGRSGQSYEYLKGRQWLDIRDEYRRSQLRGRSEGGYAVINVASRLFPHDPFDMTLIGRALDAGLERHIVEIIAYLAERNLHIFWRGFPARLLENIQKIQHLCALTAIRRTSVITTGSSATTDQLRVLNQVFTGNGLINEYGAQDCGIQLYSCPCCGLFHTNNPRSLITVVAGRVFATDLYSFTQPVIAMATDDLAILNDSTCPGSHEPGFMPRPMPGVLPIGSRQQAMQGAMPSERSFLLTAAGADSGLSQLIQAAGLQAIHPAAGFGSPSPNHALDRLVSFAVTGLITSCRDQLETSLNTVICGRFARQHTSLIAYLLGHLMLVTASDWRKVLEIWISLDPDFVDFDSQALLQRTLSVTLKHSCGCAEELRRLHIQTTQLLIEILADDRPGEVLIASTSLEERLDQICLHLDDCNYEQLSLALPILCSIKGYLLAHLWRRDDPLMVTLMEVWKGSDNSRIRQAEAVHRSGLLRKT